MRVIILLITCLYLVTPIFAQSSDSSFTCIPFKAGNMTAIENKPFCLLSRNELQVIGYNDVYSEKQLDLIDRYMYIYQFDKAGMVKISDGSKTLSVKIINPLQQALEADLRQRVQELTKENEYLQDQIIKLKKNNTQLSSEIKNLTQRIQQLEEGAPIINYLNGDDVIVYLNQKAEERKNLDILFTSLLIVIGFVSVILLIRWIAQWRDVSEI